MRRPGLAAEEEDAWGEPEGPPADNSGPKPRWAAPPPKPPPTPARAAAAAAAAASRQPAAAQPAAQRGGGGSAHEAAGPDSLHAICLGVLGEHLGDLLDDPDVAELLPLLPAQAKACLLAVARLRALLCDAALALLADAEQSVLDLRGCGGAVTEAGIQRALQRMQHLRQVDLTGCAVGADTLRVLGEHCPAVEVLRLGSPTTDETAGRGLRDILPALDLRRQAPAAESWDALLECDDAQQLAAAVAGGGRLMQLACVSWPNIPYRLAEHCRTACPHVALNPSSSEAAALRLPPACDPAVPLDAPLLAAVAGSARWERAPEGAPPPPELHIAERFRLAYVSRSARVKKVLQRNWQAQQRREQRQAGAGERLIAQWEGEL